MINPYNKEILARHKSNMDVQFVINSYALLSYITAYMMKANEKISKLMKTAIDDVKTKQNLKHREKLQFVANCWQNGSEISAQECVYHLLSMPLSNFSRSIVFILTFPKNERYQMVKNKDILQEMNPDSTNIYVDGLIEHYTCRPDIFENMSLIYFAAFFNFISSAQYEKIINKKPVLKNQRGKRIANKMKNYLQENRDDDDFDELLDEKYLNGQHQKVGEFFKLKNKMGWIQRRGRSKIVRYRNYEKDKATERLNYFREQMMLYYPFRNDDQIEDHGNLENVYRERIEIIAEKKSEFNNIFGYSTNELEMEKIANELDEIREDRLEEECEEYLNAAAILEADDDDLNESQLLLREELEAEFGHYARIETDAPRAERISDNDTILDELYTNKKMMTNKLYYNELSTLNITQQRYIMTVVKQLSNNEKFYNLIIGPGGCGKSYVIKLINQAVLRLIDNKLSQQDLVNSDDPQQKPTYVLMASFLGKVAFRLRGSTIHSAFSIRLGDFVDSGNYEKMRKRFGIDIEARTCALQLIIFDEVSLIDKRLFSLVDTKLRGMLNKPDEVFGGIPIILSGDFNQNKPVGNGGFIFEKDMSGYKALQKNNINELWEQFELIELNEIMRQREDKEFSEALTYFGNTGFIDLPKRYLNIFNECICPQESIPDNALFLFATNKDRKSMNDDRISKPYFKQYAFDKVHGAFDDKDAKLKHTKYIQSLDMLPDDKKHFMSNMIKIKIDIKYMFLYNDDISDGIANGTVGTLKNYIMDTKHENQIDILFFDFYENDIGYNRRSSFVITPHILSKLVVSMSDEQLKKLTPIKRVSAKINIAPSRFDWYFKRTQFQIVPCEAMTISKIQGDTCEVVALDISQNMSDMRSNYYVAMSRVTKKENLYLYGGHCLIGNKRVGNGYGINPKRFISSLTVKEKQAARQYYLENSVVQVEMARMRRDKKVVLDFGKIFADKDENSISLMFYNVDKNFKKKFDVIKNDFGIKNCDILIFTNCTYDRLNDKKNEFNLNDFDLVKYSGPNDVDSHYGTFLYKKKERNHLDLTLLRTNDQKESASHIELTLFKLNLNKTYIYICYIQNNKCNDIDDFYTYVKKFLQNSVQEKCLSESELKSQVLLLVTHCNGIKLREKDVNHVSLKLKSKWNFLQVFDVSDVNFPMWCLTNSKLFLSNDKKTSNNVNVDYEKYFSLISRYLPIWLNFKN
jgi:putative transposon-encoded protein